MKSARLELRITPEWLTQVDDWRRQQPAIPSRNEAVRLLVELGLVASTMEFPGLAEHRVRLQEAVTQLRAATAKT